MVSSGTIIYQAKAAKKRCSKVVFKKKSRKSGHLFFGLVDFFSLATHFPRAAADLTKPTTTRTTRHLLVLG